MKKKYMFILLSYLLITPLIAVDADAIIDKVDLNYLFEGRTFSATMIIENRGRTLTKKFSGVAGEAGKKSFMVYTNREDQGVKYLKIKDELWIYFPDADDIMKISGHMLKKGIMGSDISYEDMLENEKMRKKYRSELVGEKTITGEMCDIVKLTATDTSARYFQQILYVSRKTAVPLKMELFARGGRLIREYQLSDVRNVGGKYIAFKIVIQDKRKKNSLTTIIYNTVEDGKIDDKIFTKRSLRK